MAILLSSNEICDDNFPYGDSWNFLSEFCQDVSVTCNLTPQNCITMENMEAIPT